MDKDYDVVDPNALQRIFEETHPPGRRPGGDSGVGGVGGRLGTTFGRVWSALGKGASYVLLAFFEVWLGYKLSLSGNAATSVPMFAALLVPVNTAVYGVGGFKLWQKYRNGSNGQAQPSQPSSLPSGTSAPSATPAS